jgi:hypothetical protein
LFSGAAGGGVRISVSGEPKVPGAASTIAEEAVDQLQENEKLVAGKLNSRWHHKQIENIFLKLVNSSSAILAKYPNR